MRHTVLLISTVPGQCFRQATASERVPAAAAGAVAVGAASEAAAAGAGPVLAPGPALSCVVVSAGSLDLSTGMPSLLSSCAPLLLRDHHGCFDCFVGRDCDSCLRSEEISKRRRHGGGFLLASQPRVAPVSVLLPAWRPRSTASARTAALLVPLPGSTPRPRVSTHGSSDAERLGCHNTAN